MTEYLCIDHVQLGMPPGGEDAARRFYGEVLGLVETAPPPPLHGIWFRAGDVEIHLHEDAGHHASRRVHPALRVTGLDAVMDRCDASGHPTRPDTRYPGRRRFYVADPFGNELEILEVVTRG